MRAHIIGIAGPSSSGKTALAVQTARRLPGTAIVSLDSYYRGMEEIAFEQRVNFDHPDALDQGLLHEHLQAIAAGRAFDEPARTAETRRIEPHEFLIVEGCSFCIGPEVCYARRLRRDVAERGRTPESVRDQYERTVRPGAERFVIPTREHADIVVSGVEPLEASTEAVIRALFAAKGASA